jgi:hypothetical protein
VSITRLVVLVSLDITNQDVTWVFIDPQIWTCVELNIAVVCACLPQLRPLLLLLTTGSATGTVAVSGANLSRVTANASKKSPWASAFSNKDNKEADVSFIPLVSVQGGKEPSARYMQLDEMESVNSQSNRSRESKPGQWQVSVQTNWDVSTERSR